MARKVFFSFHYQRDLWRVNVVRNSAMIEGVSAAGFHDQSLWEETKKRGDDAVRRLIDTGLEGTTVTVVLIGAETANRRYVSYEIDKSVARGNGLLGVRINNIKDENGCTDLLGAVPAALTNAAAAVYTWEYGKLGEWVENAYQAVQRR
ncbi:MAG: TIR domain-containing protein [Solirubrobacterales bacterium]|nr:TIR domain-containing protein [Solirubrobacterales bacterium]